MLPTSYRHELSRISGNNIWPDIEKNISDTAKAANLRPRSSWQNLQPQMMPTCFSPGQHLALKTLVQQNKGPEDFKRPGEHKFSTAPGRVQGPKYLTSQSSQQTFLESLANGREAILSCTPLKRTRSAGTPNTWAQKSLKSWLKWLFFFHMLTFS